MMVIKSMINNSNRINSLLIIARILMGPRLIRSKGRVQQFKMKPKLAIRKDNKNQQRK